MSAGPDEGNGVSGEGAARELLSALHNLHALLRSPRVGPKVIEPLLPEIRRRVTVLARGATLAVTPFENATIPAAIAKWETRLVSALDDGSLRHVDARTRLALESAIGETASRIDALREAVEIRARHEAPSLELLLGSLVDEALATPVSTRPFGLGVRVRTLSPHDRALAVLAAPQTALLLVAFAVSFAAAGAGEGGQLPLTLEAKIQGESIRLVVGRSTPAAKAAADLLFVVPAATAEAELLLFYPHGPLTRDDEGRVSFSLPRGLADSSVEILR